MRTTRRSSPWFGLLREHLDRDARLRPLAGIVDEIADHLLEVLLLAAKARALRRVDVDRDAAVVVDLLHGARERRHHRPHVGDGADHRDARREPRALEMARDLIAHDLGLLAHLDGERIVAVRGRLVHHHRERRLERMREIADMGARALDDLAVGVDQRVGLARQRRDLDREGAFEPLGRRPSGSRPGPRRCA